MAIENRDLSPQTTLVARYKGETYTCTVVEEEGSLRFRLPGGQTFKSPSGAARAVVNGSANGWRFWSLPDGEGQPSDRVQRPAAGGAKRKPGSKATKTVKVIKKLPNQKGADEGTSRWFCSACMQAFNSAGSERPEQCPQGHAAEARDEPVIEA